MTNPEHILNYLATTKTLADTYYANPTPEGWSALNARNNGRYEFAERHPITRNEYEKMVAGKPVRDDDTIYRVETWNSGGDVWNMAHTARRSQLLIERGQPFEITPDMLGLGLEMVTGDGLPDGFTEYYAA